MLLRFLPFFLEIGLLVFCLIDCIQTPPEDCRNLGKGWWVLLILFFPIIGGVAWLVAGRPQRSRYQGWRQGSGFPEYDRPRPHTRAPDDDPEFIRGMKRVNDEHEETLRKWEEDLRRRESELRRDDDPA